MEAARRMSDETRRTDNGRAHAVLFPLPLQGHINAFAQLSALLIRNNVFVTFLNTQDVHEKLAPKSIPRIRFLSFACNLSPLPNFCEFYESFARSSSPHIQRIISESKRSASAFPPVTVLISDGILTFTKKIADDNGIPRVSFRTTGVSSFLPILRVALLLKRGFVPLPEGEGRRREFESKAVDCIPSMRDYLRVKDLPNIVRATNDGAFQLLLEEMPKTDHASLLLFNTWEDLEGRVIDDLNVEFADKVAAIGPLLLQSPSPIIQGLWPEDSSCLNFLDKQKPKSVLYVSFGSIAAPPTDDLSELARGLEATERPILWISRPDPSTGVSFDLPAEFVCRTKERFCFVHWVPQTKVLNHPSVGGFLTHCGWNSVSESLCAGVPMICWPMIAEQHTNCRLVCSVWKAGLDLDPHDGVRRDTVTSLVTKLWDDVEGEGLRRNARAWRESALRAVSSGGSSLRNLRRLLQIATANQGGPSDETNSPSV